MGKTAATLLSNSIEKTNVDYTKELVVLPSVLIERNSTRGNLA
ncbi:MAG TPA: hypothetical protein PKC39_05700 [Ferruginibacter sp.]|nr:hypothetical protein [Ferruginibacter sp.]HMP20435.1 hypothetical protein [Ferruginibacter sp.]